MFEMKAAVKSTYSMIYKGWLQWVCAEIVLNKIENILTVPENCIEFSGDTCFVYTLKSENPQTFEKKEVKQECQME